MDNDFLYIANWKMELPYNSVRKLVLQLKSSSLKAKKLVICPSFESLEFCSKELCDTSIKIGAQHCSSFSVGAFTGSVSAKSLGQIGCSYCLVGHSEQMSLSKEGNKQNSLKVLQLLNSNIIPIFCINSLDKEVDSKLYKENLKEELKYLFKDLLNVKKGLLYIALEPLWAIGTGVTPSSVYIENAFNAIKELFKENLSHIKVLCIYGGSVNQETIVNLKKISQLNGVLIGKASINFQSLEKIVT